MAEPRILYGYLHPDGRVDYAGWEREFQRQGDGRPPFDDDDACLRLDCAMRAPSGEEVQDIRVLLPGGPPETSSLPRLGPA